MLVSSGDKSGRNTVCNEDGDGDDFCADVNDDVPWEHLCLCQS